MLSDMKYWECVNEMAQFEKELKEHDKKISSAKSILDDSNYPWKPGQKEKAEKKYAVLVNQNQRLHRLHTSFNNLIRVHEDFVNEVLHITEKEKNISIISDKVNSLIEQLKNK